MVEWDEKLSINTASMAEKISQKFTEVASRMDRRGSEVLMSTSLNQLSLR